MNNLNSIIIEGNVVKQADISEPMAGFKKCVFSVAVNRWYKTKNGDGTEEVSYFDIETYGRMAEYCEKKTTKGRGVRVVGRLKQSRWQDKDGKKFSRIFIVAEHIEYKPVLDNAEAAESDVYKDSSPVAEDEMLETSGNPENELVAETEETVF